jgi:hypothetical protein
VTSFKKKTQRDFFLVITVIGTFICLAFIAIAIFMVTANLPQVTDEIAARDWRALAQRAQNTMPASCGFAALLAMTWFAYRRYRSFLEPCP